MKAKVLVIFLFCAILMNAQTFTPMSYDDYMAPFVAYKQAFDKANNEIRSVETIIMNALGNDIDETLREQLNSDYNRLSRISQTLNKSGMYGGIWNDINNVRTSVNNHINSYNSRVAALRRQQEALEEARRQEEIKRREEQTRLAREAGWTGSGFALNNGYVVTNYHVVENAKTIEIKGVKGDFTIGLKANVVATDKVNDIAVLKIIDERFSGFGVIPYKIKRTMSDVGETVWALGYPMIGMMGEEIKFTDGKISARTGLQGDMSTYQISVPLQPGNSGGPLFDKNGFIIGINSSGINKLYSEQTIQTENVNYAIKTSYLFNVIESALTTSVLPQGTVLQGRPLTEQIKLAQKFIFIIHCLEYDNSISIQKNEDTITTITQNTIESTPNTTTDQVVHTTVEKRTTSTSISNPEYTKSNTGVSIVRVTLTPDYTRIDCNWHNRTNANGAISIKEGAFLKSNKFPNEKFVLYNVEGINFSPERTIIGPGEVTEFSLYFRSLPQNIDKFDLIVPNGWEFYDIKISNTI